LAFYEPAPMNFLRATFRLVSIIFVTSWFLIPLVILQWLKGYSADRALQTRLRTAQPVVKLLGVKITLSGQLPQDAFVFIGNHRSYFDPVVALKFIKAFPVAKAEVQNWPLIGFAVKATGVLFVKRENKQSRKNALEGLTDCIKSGHSVLVYPEGTTTDFPKTVEFRRGAFQMAAGGGFGIVPVAIEYKNPADAWIGDDTFIPHFFRCFGKSVTEVKIAFGPALYGEDGEELLREVQFWIDSKLTEFRREWNLPLS